MNRTDHLRCGKYITYHLEKAYELETNFQIYQNMEWHSIVVGFEAIYYWRDLDSSIIQAIKQQVQHKIKVVYLATLEWTYTRTPTEQYV